MSDFHTGKPLDASAIRQLFAELGERLSAQGLVAEIAVYGGSAVAVMFDFRDSTQDVDFTGISGDVSALAGIAADIGKRDGLSEGWFNDAIEVFISDHPEFLLQGEYGEPTGLRVFTASPRYVLAMKVMSMRSSLSSSDPRDVWHLLDACDIKGVDAALNLVAQFYPDKEVPEKNRLILMDLIEEKQAGRPYNKMIAW